MDVGQDSRGVACAWARPLFFGSVSEDTTHNRRRSCTSAAQGSTHVACAGTRPDHGFAWDFGRVTMGRWRLILYLFGPAGQHASGSCWMTSYRVRSALCHGGNKGRLAYSFTPVSTTARQRPALHRGVNGFHGGVPAQQGQDVQEARRSARTCMSSSATRGVGSRPKVDTHLLGGARSGDAVAPQGSVDEPGGQAATGG